ncbi:MAG TPA: hypothetical protein VJQ54_19510 [Candidatus Sulfotelmatobacter sp.]|nr:hypothetical protein [Candidatus Sulfotelmatobacter sp.]
MPALSAQVDQYSIVIEVGQVPVRVNTNDPEFLRILHGGYGGFLSSSENTAIDFDVEITPPLLDDPDADVEVSHARGRWFLRRGDFRAEWNPATRRGWVRQTANPYAIDSVLRIVHSLVLAQQGGFLLHSASAIRNGKAFLFAGESGAGKTTISSLMPPDAILLTDEIAYVRRHDEKYIAFGTPFTGELARPGQNVSAPIATLYLLGKGKENRIDPVEPVEAARSLLANMLFFAKDEPLVQAVFHSAFEFVQRVPVARLTFVPDTRVWELIG